MVVAIASLLDPAGTQRVHELLARLRETLGREELFVSPFPHLSYQIAEDYPVAALRSRLRELATTLGPVPYRTAGLARFAGERPVLYLSVDRTEALLRAHRRIWQVVTPLARNASALYEEASWVPHVTLLQGAMTEGELGRAARSLDPCPVHFEGTASELAILEDRGGLHRVIAAYPAGAL